jgi:hypothetical protein
MFEFKRRCYIVTVSEYGEFWSMLSLCEEIVSRFKLHPIFVFDAGYALASEHGRLVEARKWSWLQFGKTDWYLVSSYDVESEFGYLAVAVAQTPPSSRSTSRLEEADSVVANIFNRVVTRVVKLGLKIYSRVIELKRKLANARKAGLNVVGVSDGVAISRHIVSETEPAFILGGQDYALSVMSFLAHAACSHGIRAVIVPFSMAPTSKEILESLSGHSVNRLSNSQASFVRRFLPRWVNFKNDRAYSRLPLDVAFESERRGLAPTNPWLPNSGLGIVCAPSSWAYDYYIRAGIPESNLRLTGAAWSDRLVGAASTRDHRRRRLLLSAHRALRSRSKIAGRTKVAERLVIVSWPPNQYPRKAAGCGSYQELCAQFLRVCRELQLTGLVSVIVSMHPTLTDEKLVKSLRSSGVYVNYSSLIDYIDCADLFVGTVSSTCFWALQCNVPTINFDGYLYNYAEFEEAGALTAVTPNEVLNICLDLLGGDDRYAEVVRKIPSRAQRFFMDDGLCLERIMAVISTNLVGVSPS